MKEYENLDDVPDINQNFILKPKGFTKEAYFRRTGGNLDWLTKREQEVLRFATVGIAGCSDSLLAATLLRAGVGHLKILDLKGLDVIATARILRNIASDTYIHVYPEGIGVETLPSFKDECDVIADEIELWAIHSRLQLHENIHRKTTILNCRSVGMGARLFKFAASSAWGMGEILGISLEEAGYLEKRIQEKSALADDVLRVQEAVLRGLFPEIPEYMADKDIHFDKVGLPMLANNHPISTGFLASHIILEILRKKSSLKRKVVYPPDMPGYLYLDAAQMRAEVRQTIWWT